MTRLSYCTLLDHMYLVHRAFHQSLCGYTAVSCQDILLQRTRIYSYANRNIPFSGAVHHSAHTFPASDIAGIDADLVRSVLHGCDRHAIIEVNIRHQRDVNIFLNLSQRLRRFQRRNRGTDDIASASSSARIWRTVASTSSVFVFVMDWIAIG